MNTVLLYATISLLIIKVDDLSTSRPLPLLFSSLRLPILYPPSKPAYSLSHPTVDVHHSLAVNHQRILDIEAIHVSRDMHAPRMAMW